MAGDGQVTLGEEVLKQSARKRSAASTTTRFWPDSPALPPTPSRCSAALKPSSSSITATSGAAPSNWPRTGAPTDPAPPGSAAAGRRQGADLSSSAARRRDRARDGIAAIGSGGPYAQAAATALSENTELSAREIAEKAMKIAGKICIYTNDNMTIEEL